MRLKVPIIGTVIGFNADAAKLDGIGISGHPDDLVRIALDIGNVSWKLVSIDLVNDLAEVEVSPEHFVSIDSGLVDSKGNPIYNARPTTPIEEQGFLNDAQNRVANYKADSVRKLVKSADALKKYVDFKKAQVKVI